MKLLFTVLAFLYFAGIEAKDDYSVYIVQTMDESIEAYLDDQSLQKIEELALELGAYDITKIYASDFSYSQEVASLLRQNLGCPLVSLPVLRDLIPHSLAERWTGLKQFMQKAFVESKSGAIVVCVPKNLFRFICKHMHPKSQDISDFSYVKFFGNREEFLFFYSERPEEVFQIKRPER